MLAEMHQQSASKQNHSMLLVVLPRLQDFRPVLRPLGTGVEGTGQLEVRGTGDTVVEDIDQVVPGDTELGNLLRGTG